MLRDAYRGQVRHWLRAAAGDILAVALSIVGLQGLLAITLPQLLVPRGVLLGYPVILLLLFLVRWQVGSFLQARPSASNLSLQELTTEIRDFEANVRRAVRLELSACAVMIPILAAASWYETSPVGKTGYGLTAAGVAFVGWFLLRYGRIRAMAAELGFEETVQAYRYHLQKSMKFSSTYHWWYLLPLSIGPMVLTIGTSGIGIWMLAPIGIWIMFAGLLLLWQKQYRDRTRRRLDELAIATEKSSQ
jgi:hypothetical protein